MPTMSERLEAARKSLKEFDHRVPVGRWRVPATVAVDLDCGVLTWSPIIEGDRVVGRERRMLEEFINLAIPETIPWEALGAKVEAYAREWGPLHLCTHGVPCTDRAARHPRDAPPPHLSAAKPKVHRARCAPMKSPPEDSVPVAGYCEWLSDWRTWSRRMYAVVRLDYRLRGDQVTSVADWQQACYLHPRDTWSGRTRIERRQLLWQVVNGWLRAAGVMPQLDVSTDGSRPELAFDGDGLFGALVIEMTMIVAGLRGITLCAECGKLYRPGRQRPGQLHHCPVCTATGARQRNCMAAKRARDRAGG